MCQRFTTSKLSTFEDLSSIATYGFRGEALASISHISHLTVTTKTIDSACAWRVTYLDGKPTGSAPTAVAGRDGTQITVEDLFYNVPSRLRAFKSPAEEYGKILDVVGRYACHCANVSFSCKKFGDSYPSLTVPASTKSVDRIRSVYGTSVAAELIAVEVPANERYGFKGASGLVTNPNYSAKRATAPVLFINHRSVACDPLRKGLNGVYVSHLPRGGHYFAYLALDIDTRNLDVNVHPTKREVRFLYEDEIIEHICSVIQEALANCGASRTFQTQTVFPGARSAALLKDSTMPSISSTSSSSPGSFQKRPYEYNLVRTDSKQAKLTTMFGNTPIKSRQSEAVEDSTTIVGEPVISSSCCGSPHDGVDNMEEPDTQRMAGSGTPSSAIPGASQYKHIEDKRDRVDVRLRSVRALRDQIEANAHEALTQVFSDHMYIGIVDFQRRLCAFQQGVRMFIVDYGVLSQELFYQAAIADFSNFGTLSLEVEGSGSDEADSDEVSGISIYELLKIVNEELPLDNAEATRMTDNDIDTFLEQLWDMRQMFQEYFSITFTKQSNDTVVVTEEGISKSGNSNRDLRLTTLPMLIKGYIPPFSKLPSFLRTLASEVSWDSEQDCLNDVAKALSKFYTPEPVLTKAPRNFDEESEDENNKEEDDDNLQRQHEISEYVERLIFPAIKSRLLAPKWMVEHVVEIANLPGLYKVFERC